MSGIAVRGDPSDVRTSDCSVAVTSVLGKGDIASSYRQVTDGREDLVRRASRTSSVRSTDRVDWRVSRLGSRTSAAGTSGLRKYDLATIRATLAPITRGERILRALGAGRSDGPCLRHGTATEFGRPLATQPSPSLSPLSRWRTALPSRRLARGRRPAVPPPIAGHHWGHHGSSRRLPLSLGIEDPGAPAGQYPGRAVRRNRPRFRPE
jgi:hypothetical protein